MERPANNAKCGFCEHTFGQHYSSFDGSKSGCTYYYDDQRDGGPCGCKGFATIYKYTPPTYSSGYPYDR